MSAPLSSVVLVVARFVTIAKAETQPLASLLRWFEVFS